MADVKLNHIYKVYPNGTKAVNDFTMDIKDKEFIVFVGPSGCGKSTTLRMIAGLEEITAGELYIGDTLVNDVEPKDRDIAMVFQNYALYPHMTVYENMAFGLKLRKLPKAVIDQKVREAAQTLDITDYLDKKPKEMSGGQRQRVALGRAIVREPKVFLLDEPLSNLDAKLRTAMRSEISALHHRLQTTFIYVTHDQVEAMTMGTRIVVMKDGFVQQIDTPTNLYRYPQNVFVAGFIGTPQMNFINAEINVEGDDISFVATDAPLKIALSKDFFAKAKQADVFHGKKVVLGLRAEHISIDAEKYTTKAKIKVSHIEELGTESQVFGDLNFDKELGLQSSTKIVIKAPTMTRFEVGSVTEISFDIENMQVFDAETEANMIPRIPDCSVISVVVKKHAFEIGSSRIELPSAFSMEDGNYKLTIPVDAVEKGNDVVGTVKKVEEVNGKYLHYVETGGQIIFALFDEETSGEITLGIDLKKVTCSIGDKIVHEAIPAFNTLSGKMLRQRNKDKRTFKEIVKSAAIPKFSFETMGHRFECTRELASKLVGIGGTKIIGKALSFEFSPQDVEIATDGIPFSVEKILDYGTERYAKCERDGVVLYAKVGGDFNEESIDVVLPVDKMSIFDVEDQIRLK